MVGVAAPRPRRPELAAIPQPTLLVYGIADPVGTVEIWRRVVDLLPRGELQLVDGAGHMPWLDDPCGVAGHVSRFLARAVAVAERWGPGPAPGPHVPLTVTRRRR